MDGVFVVLLFLHLAAQLLGCGTLELWRCRGSALLKTRFPLIGLLEMTKFCVLRMPDDVYSSIDTSRSSCWISDIIL